ncbi:hypothetical protein HanRHA438_Chr02g0067801 [Helianthus annuus]|nr:hypothetical protein HanRHA438_Chr02g0067801 [Helianthus annuus]
MIEYVQDHYGKVHITSLSVLGLHIASAIAIHGAPQRHCTPPPRRYTTQFQNLAEVITGPRRRNQENCPFSNSQKEKKI